MEAPTPPPPPIGPPNREIYEGFKCVDMFFNKINKFIKSLRKPSMYSPNKDTLDRDNPPVDANDPNFFVKDSIEKERIRMMIEYALHAPDSESMKIILWDTLHGCNGAMDVDYIRKKYGSWKDHKNKIKL